MDGGGDTKLIQTLLERLSSKLPNRSGDDLEDVRRDEVVILSRGTLIELSKTQIETVARGFISLLDNLIRQYDQLSSKNRPTLVVLTQSFLVELLAECVRAHWDSVDEGLEDDPHSRPDARRTAPGPQFSPSTARRIHRKEPPSLDDALARHILDIVLRLSSTTMPSDEYIATNPQTNSTKNGSSSQLAEEKSIHGVTQKATDMDKASFEVIEYISASNWSMVFQTLQSILKQLRVATSDELDTNGLQLLAHLWLNSKRLSAILAELYASFLHLRKPYQLLISLLLPETIHNWIDSHPYEFVNLHLNQRRLEGRADALFDIANNMADSTKKRAILWPMQTSLVLLLPEVFILASMLGEVSRSTNAKRVLFLETLRKSLRLPRSSDIAATCLVTICRAASHFSMDSDSAVLSFALDVQNEMREEIFKRQHQEDTMVDREVMIKAFVSLCHLSKDQVIDTLVPRCLDRNAPLSFKITVFAGTAIIAAQDKSDEFVELYRAIAPDIREYLHTIGAARKNGTSNNVGRKLDIQSSDSIASVELLYQILELLKVRPYLLYEGAPKNSEESGAFFEKTLSSILNCITDDDTLVRTLSAEFARRLISRDTTSIDDRVSQSNKTQNELQKESWKGASAILVTFSRKLLDFDLSDPALKVMLGLVRDYMETRLQFLRNMKVVIEASADVGERQIAGISLEVSFLVLLCSSDLDICSLTTSAIGILCEEGRLTENLEDLERSGLSVMKNYAVYSELSSQTFRMTGPVAFQKRLRKLLARMNRSTAGILTAWEAIFMKWETLCKDVVTSINGKVLAVDERTLVEWRNYSGFLAALGGCCIATPSHEARGEDNSMSGLRWIDRLAFDGENLSLLERFMRQCLQLLVCDNVTVRENIRDVLGSEMNPRLYVQFFRSLELELSSLYENPSTVPATEIRLLFAEQVTSLLRAIIERIEDSQESLLSVDFGGFTLILARYLHTLKDDAVTLRAKIKMCQLVEVVSRKKDILNLRQDVRVRNSLLQILTDWMSRAGKAESTISVVGARKDEIMRLQKDLDRAALKALVNLLARLPLQPTESHDADALDAKSQLFCTYFQTFLTLLEGSQHEVDRIRDLQVVSLSRDDSSSTLELAILALSNLLSANVDVGLKFSLEIGYHQNLEIRTAFMHVLTNILTQGTEFSSLGDSAIGEKYERLINMLVKDHKFAYALCDSCPSSEVDEIAVALLNIFDSKGLGLTLLKELIEQEVKNTESESELLRRNCVATKMLSIFAKWKGAAYLRSTLQRVLERLLGSSDELDLELDPERTTSKEELQRNALQLRFVTNVFIDEICKSVNNVPVTFRFICHTITTSVTNRFPEAKFTAVGAFIFLRFFCPAIVAPDSEGLVTSIPQKGMRRGLLLIAKVVQNLANNVLFGAKEPYMIPLNDFLTANIYRVTTFLRDISSPLPIPDQTSSHENFDFGSSIALHRFLYDHWETVRQKLLHQERLRSRLEIASFKEEDSDIKYSIAEFSALVPTLGPPPLDMSWSRPQMASNIQPAYFRFQQFMLRFSGRSVEPITSARIVYDGGESKDGMPVICFTMRNLNVELIDHELLIYCYLKIASRLWQKPFAVLIDATSYTINNELPDEVTRKLETLMPPEMVKNFKRVYVYNMNSAYRKCFRRLVRHACKDESNSLHPKNMEYLLFGSLAELQNDFQLASLHLPKDTISLETDSRFLFKSVIRLSKTKGKIDVIIKVGSQYIQITTTKKQEIVPGLRMLATVNDIFLLSEIEEANASFHTDEENAFGIKTENGKVAMFFSSPKRLDILSTIKAAKSKQLKDHLPSKLNERIIRPEDVPGTLLNIALMNMGSQDHSLRISAYNLLCALCQTFRFNVDRHFISARGLSIPADSISLIVGVSERLSTTEPQLTFDFLTEFFVGWPKSPPHQRPLNILYMAPWLVNLQSQVLAFDGDSERGKERLANIARKLIEITVKETSLYTDFQQNAWSIISRDESLLEVFFEELIKNAVNAGFGSPEADIIGSIVSSFGTLTMRGKIIARLRKALNRTSLRPTRHLKDNVIWKEMCVLLRICLAISFDSRAQAQMFLPELFHIITMVVNCGTTSVRMTVHSLLVNTVHSICTSFPLDEENRAKLRGILVSLSEPKLGLLFNLNRPTTRDGMSMEEQRSTENASTSSMEIITNLLLEIIATAAPSIDMANIWRARWMSLVASTAFQNNPAIQPRAFSVMGCLAKEDVDDDLLYQVLVALRSALARYIEQADFEMLASIITSLTKMTDNLPPTSRYLHQMFWLSMSLIRVGPPLLFNCSANLLQAVLQVIASSDDFKDGRMGAVLMQGRFAVEEAAAAIDNLFGIRFDIEHFSFCATMCIMKGLSDPTTRTAASRTFMTFLEVTTSNLPSGERGIPQTSIIPYLGCVGARASTVEELKEISWACGLPTPEDAKDFNLFDLYPAMSKISKVDLFLSCVVALIDFRTLDESVQVVILAWFETIAIQRPDVFRLLHDQIISNLEDTLSSSQNSTILKSTHSVMRKIASDRRYGDRRDSQELLATTLEEFGFPGAWSSTSFKAITKEQEKKCAALIDRLIELIIA